MTEASLAETDRSVEDLLQKCRFLLVEIDELSRQLHDSRTVPVEGLVKSLRTPLLAEQKTLESLNVNDLHDEAVQSLTTQQISSNNVPFFEVHWAVAKRSQDVIAVNKRFHFGPNKLVDSAKVDIVARDGREWIKVMHITERRILHELAKLGWSQEDSDDEGEFPLDDDEDEGISILRMGIRLSKAAKAHRIHYQHPRIRMIFTRLKENRIAQIDKLLRSIRTLPHVTIEMIDLPDIRIPSISDAFTTMAFDPFTGLSHTLNIDCTVLLAMVSDLSHVPVENQLWFSDYTKTQIEEEKTTPVLKTYHYPVMDSHPLVTTREAAALFQWIVNEIGTETEKRRASLLVYDEQEHSETLSPQERHAQWSQLSSYDVSIGFQLPVRVVSSDEETIDEDFLKAQPFPTRLAGKVADSLTDSNTSVFIYGWRTGRTTISSNVVTTNKIRQIIEANRNEEEDDVRGPDIWHRAPSRSLLSKEKQKKDRTEQKNKSVDSPVVDGNQ